MLSMLQPVMKFRRKNNFTNMKKINILVIALVAIFVVGGGIYFLGKKSPTGEKLTDIEKSLKELVVSGPELDLSFSPLPSLKSSSLNLPTPSLPSSNIFGGFSVNADFSYQGDVTIKSPEVPFSYTPPKQTQQQGQGQQQGGQQQQQGQVNTANCTPFSSVPSAQYCSMVSDPNGRALCEQCKAAGL